MSNHAFQPRTFTLERKQVSLFAVVDIGTSSACTLMQWVPSQAGVAGYYVAAATSPVGPAPAGFAGVFSVAKKGTGDFIVTLQQSYQRLLGANVTHVVATAAASLTPFCSVVAAGTNVGIQATPQTGGGVVELLFSAAAGGAGADPTDGEQLLIEFLLGDSTAI